ncbi:MAG: alanine racemase [Phycisphaerae bacterium]
MLDDCGTLIISRASFAHNVAFYRSLLPPKAEISAVVKANAYGHGLPQIVELLMENNIRWCSVFSVHEAWMVLGKAPSMNVHVLCPLSFSKDISPAEIPDVWRQILALDVDKKLYLTIQSIRDAERLNSLAQTMGRRIQVHVQIDVGLTRQGCTAEVLPKLLAAISNLPRVELRGVFAHFSHGEMPDSDITARQYTLFHRLVQPLRSQGILVHIHNSGGTYRKLPVDVDLVRLGIGLYGLQPSLDYPNDALQPVAELRAPILAVHKRSAGTGVGYGHQFVTARPSRLAIIPVGYGDGYRRELGGSAVVEIDRHSYPVVGRVSMDQIVVDVTDGNVHEGDTATLISSDPRSDISMDHLAKILRTISYEIATGLGTRIVRQLT